MGLRNKGTDSPSLKMLALLTQDKLIAIPAGLIVITRKESKECNKFKEWIMREKSGSAVNWKKSYLWIKPTENKLKR